MSTRKASLSTIGAKGVVAALAFATGIGLVGEASAANLLSGDVSIGLYYPDDTTPFPGYGPFVGPTAAGITEPDGSKFTFTGNTISFNIPYGGKFADAGPGGFNGFLLQFTGVPTITGVTNDASSQLNPVALTFAGNWVKINFNGLKRNSPTTSIFDVTLATAPGVPEPATWTMLLLGFGGLGVALRRSRRLAAPGVA